LTKPKIKRLYLIPILSKALDVLELLEQTNSPIALEDVYQQTNFASYLAQAGQPKAAIAWLKQQLARPEQRTPSEDESLRTALAEQYRNQAPAPV